MHKVGVGALVLAAVLVGRRPLAAALKDKRTEPVG